MRECLCIVQNVVTNDIDVVDQYARLYAMAKRGAAAHVVTTSRQYKGKTYRTHRLRRNYRQDGKVISSKLLADRCFMGESFSVTCPCGVDKIGSAAVSDNTSLSYRRLGILTEGQ